MSATLTVSAGRLTAPRPPQASSAVVAAVISQAAQGLNDQP